jgi:hypothetical protein
VSTLDVAICFVAPKMSCMVICATASSTKTLLCALRRSCFCCKVSLLQRVVQKFVYLAAEDQKLMESQSHLGLLVVKFWLGGLAPSRALDCILKGAFRDWAGHPSQIRT